MAARFCGRRGFRRDEIDALIAEGGLIEAES